MRSEPIEDEDEVLTPPPPTATEILRSSAFAAPQATYPTGFAALDFLIDGGLKARQLAVVAAPTGAGKTGLALEFARRLARQIPVVYFSTELDPAESSARVAAPLINARPSELLSLTRSPTEAADAIEELPLYVVELEDCDDGPTLRTIRAQAEAVRRVTGHAPAIIIDWLQQLTADDPDGKRMSVSRVAVQLRRLARDLDVPVVAVSSVARGYYGTGKKNFDGEEDPRTWLAAAKESGDIEYAAAVFAFLDTSSEIGPTGESAARLIVAKSRRGQPGFVGLRFHGPTGRFTEASEAVEAFGPGKREAEIDRQILDVVRRSREPLVKDELRRRIAAGVTAADKGIARLLERDDLVLLDDVKMNSAGKRRARKVFAIPVGDVDHES